MGNAKATRSSYEAFALRKVAIAGAATAGTTRCRKMALRIYEVTNSDREDVSAHSMQQFKCDERDRDRYVPIPISNRNYVLKRPHPNPSPRAGEGLETQETL